MRQLDRIFDLRRDIDSLEERLIELRQMTQPKAQIISDMPRGGGERKNLIEEYVIKSEKLTKKMNIKKAELEDKWKGVVYIFEESCVTSAQQAMLKYRFYYAKPWKTCVKCMRELYPDSKWNEQKLFRMYRDVLHKINRLKA